VDAFYLKFRGELREDARAVLNRAVLVATERRTEAPVDLRVAIVGGLVGDLRGALHPRSRDGWWFVQSAWLEVKIDDGARGRWRVEVKPSALLILREGPHAALTMARQAARALFARVEGERVSRLDLCADAIGIDLGSLDVEAFLQHRFLKVHDISTRQQFWRAGIRTGFVWGKGDGVARLYDKTEHLRSGLDDAKADDERSEWRFAGWNGTDAVARLEAQLRGKLLDELELRDPERALERLDAVWSYFTKKWIRLVEADKWRAEREKPKEQRRKDRMPTDTRWRAFQAVVFRVKSDPAKRLRAPTTPHARRLVSAVVNYCAAMGALAVHARLDPRAQVADWTNEQAETFIQQQLAFMAEPTLRAARFDLISRFDDAREAAAHLITKQGAAALKFTRRRNDEPATVAA
jgi:hypothetical protein